MKNWLLGVAVVSCSLLVVLQATAYAHPMPSSTVVLDVVGDSIDADIHVPLSELSLATGVDLQTDAAQVTSRESELRAYFTKHMSVTSKGKTWETKIRSLSVSEAEQQGYGLRYGELHVLANFAPPDGVDVRQFTLAYDAVIHQVVTHSVLVSLRQDWSAGRIGSESTRSLGTISVDIRSGTISPLEINLDSRSMWHGFLSMVNLGIEHIRTGTDHLLFLLTLLLPVPYVINKKRWELGASKKRSLLTVIKVVSAFTIGHSITLALVTFVQPSISTQAIEVLIALSIVLGAINVFRPICNGKEMWVAGFFGLIHGMAFSFVLLPLKLTSVQLALSLIGFNLGIELMQMFIVLCVAPALILLGKTAHYRKGSLLVAGLIGAISCGWAMERLGVSNIIARVGDHFGHYGVYAIVLLWTIVIYSYKKEISTLIIRK